MKANQGSLCHTRRKGIFLFLILFGLLGTAGGTAAEEAPYYRDLFSDTWVGQDAHKH